MGLGGEGFGLGGDGFGLGGDGFGGFWSSSEECGVAMKSSSPESSLLDPEGVSRWPLVLFVYLKI